MPWLLSPAHRSADQDADLLQLTNAARKQWRKEFGKEFGIYE